MTAVRSAMVFCDGLTDSEDDRCDNWIDADGGSAFVEATVAQVRAKAKSNGWKHRKGRDLCPACAEASRRVSP